MRRILSAASAAMLWCGAGSAAAQEGDVSLAAGRVTDERGQVHAGLTLAPSLTWATDDAAFQLFGQATAIEQGVLGAGGARFGATPLRRGPLRLTLHGEAIAVGSDAGYRALRASLSPRLQLAGSSWGVEAGPRWAAGGDRMQAGRTDPFGSLPVGGDRRDDSFRWQSQLGIAAGAWVGEGPVLARADWEISELGGQRWQDWRVGARLGLEHAVLGLAAGRRSGALEEQWVTGSASVPVGGSVALLVEAGGYPSDPLTGRAAGTYASLGLRLRLGQDRRLPPPSAVPPRTADGRVKLSLRAEPGARVELLGDWTGWEPRPVPETRPGEYTIEVRLPAGTHRFAFRVDGEWRLPEGVPTEPDGFGGKHAVIRLS